MSLTIYSLQRAFTAKHHMALAAGNIDNALAAVKAKDFLDSLHLGLFCEEIEFDDYCKSTSTVDEFISNCKNILSALSEEHEEGLTTIELVSGTNLLLKEEGCNITMEMSGEQVTLTDLTLRNLFGNLVSDIRTNPNLYGCCLSSFVHSLDHLDEVKKNYSSAFTVMKP